MTSKIKANNIEINYRLDGPEDRPVVMLSNSLMSNYTMWDNQIDDFTRNFRVLRYDQRGHGDTEVTPGPYSIKELTDDAYGLIEALEITAVHFVGLSMGGFTGQMLACKYPHILLSLILCDTACVMPPESLWNERIAAARDNGIKALAEGTLNRWFTPPFHQRDKVQLEKVREMILGTDVEGYVGCAEAIRNMNICESLQDITTPTLVVAGEEDPACPVSAAQVLTDGIKDSSLVIIPQSAHLPNIEQTEMFNSLLMEFLLKQ